MNVHKNARMTVHGRVLLCQRVCREGWRVPNASRAGGGPESGGSGAPAPHPENPVNRGGAPIRLRRERICGGC